MHTPMLLFPIILLYHILILYQLMIRLVSQYKIAEHSGSAVKFFFLVLVGAKPMTSEEANDIRRSLWGSQGTACMVTVAMEEALMDRIERLEPWQVPPAFPTHFPTLWHDSSWDLMERQGAPGRRWSSWRLHSQQARRLRRRSDLPSVGGHWTKYTLQLDDLNFHCLMLLNACLWYDDHRKVVNGLY